MYVHCSYITTNCNFRRCRYIAAYARARELGEDRSPATAITLGRQMNEWVEVLAWQGKREAAAKVAEDAARLANWPGPLQRPVHFYDSRIKSTPWMTLAKYPTVQNLARSMVKHLEV